MSELLTTGEMIDRLKVGEIAKKENSDMHVTRESASVFSYCGEDGDTSGFSIVGLNGVIHIDDAKWRILPNYVSFAEAMKAIEEGKDVHCQYNDEAITIKSYDNRIGSICFDRHCESGGGAAIKIAWIVAGKWTIEED